MHPLLQHAAYVWASPYTLIGLAIGAPIAPDGVALARPVLTARTHFLITMDETQ